MIEINPPIILVQLISFLVLMFFLGKFLFSPLANFIEKRRIEINNTFSLIDKEKEEAARLIKEAHKILEEKKEEGRAIIEKAIKEGEFLKEEIIKKAKEEASQISISLINNAKREIEKERQNALLYINKISIAIARKLIKENIDYEKHKELFLEFIENIKKEDIL